MLAFLPVMVFCVSCQQKNLTPAAAPVSAQAVNAANDEIFLDAIRDDYNHSNVALKMLKEGANPNAKDDKGVTALMYAASGNFNLTAELLARGANPNAISKEGECPLSCAIGFDDEVRIIQILISHGANVNAAMNGGESTLSYASWTGGELAFFAHCATEIAHHCLTLEYPHAGKYRPIPHSRLPFSWKPPMQYSNRVCARDSMKNSD